MLNINENNIEIPP